jgi:hypothetical protein
VILECIWSAVGINENQTFGFGSFFAFGRAFIYIYRNIIYGNVTDNVTGNVSIENYKQIGLAFLCYSTMRRRESHEKNR